MNNFEAQYLKLSLKYLDEKMNLAKAKRESSLKKSVQKKSKLLTIFSNLFK